MHSLRSAVLRSAISASKAAPTAARIAPFAARAPGVSAARAYAPQTIRFFSQTVRRSNSEEKELEEAQRKSEEEFGQQIVKDARQDVEESIARTEADIQEAMQEVSASQPQEGQSAEVSASQPQEGQSAEVTSEGAAAEEDPSARYECSAFVRNLVFEITEDHLQKAFEKYGPIRSTFIARDPRGLSKGYGFVDFMTPEAMQEACANVNGSFWHGRRITCIPRSRTPAKKRNTPKQPTSQLFIGNIPYETTDAELNRLFRGLDNVTDVRVAVDRTTGWPRGFAHADFTSVEAAMEAFKRLEGATIGDRKLRVDYAEGYVRRPRRQEQVDAKAE